MTVLGRLEVDGHSHSLRDLTEVGSRCFAYLVAETAGDKASEVQNLVHYGRDAQVEMTDERAHSSSLVVKVTVVASCRLGSLFSEILISNDMDVVLVEVNMAVLQVTSDDHISPESDRDAVTVEDCNL
jgi:hypothetical protein